MRFTNKVVKSPFLTPNGGFKYQGPSFIFRKGIYSANNLAKNRFGPFVVCKKWVKPVTAKLPIGPIIDNMFSTLKVVVKSSK